MKKIVLVTAFALSQVLAVSAFAQATRAEVKAQTASAVKSGKTTEGQATAAEAKGTKPASTKARADVKSDTAAANKAGAITDGQAAAGEAKGTKAKSEKSRAEVKAETKDAVKKGEISTGQGTKP
jgi:hypothetical protein